MRAAPRALKFRTLGLPLALRSIQELDFAVDKMTLRAARGTPMIVELYVPEAGWMRIGLGLAHSVLSYRPAEAAAKGKSGRKPMVTTGSLRGDAITYWTWCEENRHGYRRERLVPVPAAREALRLFFRTGELEPSLGWEEFSPGLAS